MLWKGNGEAILIAREFIQSMVFLGISERKHMINRIRMKNWTSLDFRFALGLVLVRIYAH